MRIFGIEIARSRSIEQAVEHKVDEALKKWTLAGASSFISPVREPFAGAWQKNVQCETPSNILAFSAVFSCITLIAGDIAKLDVELKRKKGSIWQTFDEPSPFRPVLRKPNRYQTQLQFMSQWVTCLLLHGNVYVLKERDARGIVVAMYILDPRLVKPVVTPDGGVYYQINRDELAGVDDATGIVSASEIIHDRYACFWHPLIGVSPIFASGASATQGIRIQANSAAFFENMSRPSGVLTAPGTINEATATRLRSEFQKNFGGSNIGRLMIGGDGLKYEGMTMPAHDAQLIEQLRWTVEDVARSFHVPLHKVMSGQNPTFTNVGAMNQDYYGQALQIIIKGIESLLDEGLAVPDDMAVEFNLDGLLRMDPVALADSNAKNVAGAIMAPNEARQKIDLPPVEGGNTPYLQQQNYSLAALAKRDSGDPFPTAPVAGPEDDDPAPMMEDDEAVVADEMDKSMKMWIGDAPKLNVRSNAMVA